MCKYSPLPCCFVLLVTPTLAPFRSAQAPAAWDNWSLVFPRWGHRAGMQVPVSPPVAHARKRLGLGLNGLHFSSPELAGNCTWADLARNGLKWSIRRQRGVPFFKVQGSLVKSPTSQAMLTWTWVSAQRSVVPAYIVHLPNDNELSTYFAVKYGALPLHAIKQKGCKMCHSINFKQNPSQMSPWNQSMGLLQIWRN